MAQSKSLTEVLKEINKYYSAVRADGSVEPAVTVGVGEQKVLGSLSLRTPSLDYCVYNRIPEGRIIEIAGKEGSGKTTCAFLLAASFQEKEIQRHPDNPRKILYVDLEMTVDPSWALKAGYDMSENAAVKTIYLTPMDLDGETILDMVRDLIKTDEIGLCIIDSLPYLVGQQVYEESFTKKEMGGISKLLGDFVSRITSMLVRYQCTLVGINQLRDSLDPYSGPYTTPGGTKWKFGCSLRLIIKRGEFLDEDGNSLNSKAESPWGYRMEMAVLKTKVCKWDRKLGSTVFSYTDGMDILQDTIDVAIKLGLIDNSVQGTFKLMNPETKEVLVDADGYELKVRGRRNLKPWFKEHLDIFKQLYKKVYEEISKTDTSSLITFEQLMNGATNSFSDEIDFTKSEDM